MVRLARVSLVLLVCLAVGRNASARECEGVRMPAVLDVQGTQLRLNGMGIREATALQVDVYVAGLYLERTTRDGREVAQSEQRKRLVMHFVRDVEASDVRTAMTDGLRNNAGGNWGAIRARATRLVSWLSSMRVGNRMVFTYVPGTGIEVQVNGRVKGTIEGQDFARAFFTIFVGPNPPNSGLKVGLLGGECG